jgi:hypothetical protein
MTCNISNSCLIVDQEHVPSVQHSGRANGQKYLNQLLDVDQGHVPLVQHSGRENGLQYLNKLLDVDQDMFL